MDQRMQKLVKLNEEDYKGTMRVKQSRGKKAALTRANSENICNDIVISTPKLQTVNLLTADTSKVKTLGKSSRMAKAKRVEDAISFWQNQSSFHLEAPREFEDSVNANIAGFPHEMRAALASGVIHTIRDGQAKKKKRRLETIFSDDSLPLGEMVALKTDNGKESKVAAEATISFSDSDE